MSLIMFFDAPGSASPETPPSSAENGVPYPLPLSEPYNVDQLAVIPTPDGHGQTVHPDVIDFGSNGWRGYRFWMGITPFAGGDPRLENPCVFASDDGFRWVEPGEGVNPIAPAVGPVYNANSDTDLSYDPDADELVLLWREYHTGNRTEVYWLSRSANGIRWSAPQVSFSHDGSSDGNGGGVQQYTSPALVRVSEGDWRFWATMGTKMHTATSPEGPWSEPTPGTHSSGQWPYHLDVITGPDGRFWMLSTRGGNAYASVSEDGIHWTDAAEPFIRSRSGRWDQSIYRATFAPHENGTHMRMWYSALQDDGTNDEGLYSSQEWRTGYTLVEQRHWLEL